jgi:catechol 2,3-dioxygenase-like lactoylglutathione lyase family enzyme
MPTTKVSEFLYGRLQSPDLDRAETFLSEFGMVRTARTATALYMRGSEPAHHIHITELGEPRFLGLGFAVSDSGDLKRLAQLSGASGIESIDEPGGGKRVRLTDPDGHRVEIVHGIEIVPALNVRRQPINSGTNRPRNGEFQRPPRGPSHVKRLGHGVLMTTDLRRKLAWYRDTLGLLPSDDVYASSPDDLIGSFSRLDRGEAFVDHHVLFCIQGKKIGLNHLAFEVQDVDDVMIGHNHLRLRGYGHVWGVGRHQLGSHIFDYWQDPWGRVHEHWTDTDTLNAHALPGHHGTDALDGPWGEPIPRSFVEHASA